MHKETSWTYMHKETSWTYVHKETSWTYVHKETSWTYVHKETSWTNIVQVFEHLNDLPSKSPLYYKSLIEPLLNSYGFSSLASFL